MSRKHVLNEMLGIFLCTTIGIVKTEHSIILVCVLLCDFGSELIKLQIGSPMSLMPFV